jgi:hypothetical protein
MWIVLKLEPGGVDVVDVRFNGEDVDGVYVNGG